ncbi:SPOR domain-containing protein [Citreimonas salinaria]|uniref:Sporulation related domain-containing protein n=1 Tax=Citreimonas salinaria TaxID=321339 RepID=A0A1H3IVH9_9RHOB|nr:SPOR domain-containing protein [Citreimonas salinaria]SDY31773.1 Sporulation related domain-containing protein [Citreimonas salinaria]
MIRSTSTRPGRAGRHVLLAAGLLALAACADGEGPFARGDGATRAATGAATQTTERDIEAPEVFQATEAGLWDGRPSLGGVWAAHPDVDEPERVIIRNQQNGQVVIGALFRRERETPGPRLQISSDAAAALGMLAGQPTNLDVVALRRETVKTDALPAAPAVSEAGLDDTLSEAELAVETSSLEPAQPASSAMQAPAAQRPAAAEVAPTVTPAPAPRAAAATLDRAYIQIGIFSVEQNAENTATAMRQAGMVPTVKKESSNGKTFWRVVVGPARNAAERAALLEKIKASGFTDAYVVSG